jgi:hypothetical protein
VTAARRLAAILAADVAGYLRLMGEDEAGGPGGAARRLELGLTRGASGSPRGVRAAKKIGPGKYATNSQIGKSTRLGDASEVALLPI